MRQDRRRETSQLKHIEDFSKNWGIPRVNSWVFPFGTDQQIFVDLSAIAPDMFAHVLMKTIWEYGVSAGRAGLQEEVKSLFNI